MTATVTPPELTPGAMQETLRRDLPDGALLTFEFAPRDWLTKDGKPRQQPWRAYHYTPPGGERTRLKSVTTLLDAVLPKPGLTRWYEDHGARGGAKAALMGEITPDTPEEEIVQRVRALDLGAERAKREAAGRGLDIHTPLERYMKTGQAPRPTDHRPEHRGYVQGLTRFLLDFDPEPEAVEEIVCHPEHEYAGRLDLKARVRSCSLPIRELRVVDLKTQPNGGIYDSAHAQAQLYRMADERCGGGETDTPLIVVVDEHGGYDVMDCAATDEVALAALRYAAAMGPVTRACESRNRQRREARS